MQSVSPDDAITCSNLRAVVFANLAEESSAVAATHIKTKEGGSAFTWA